MRIAFACGTLAILLATLGAVQTRSADTDASSPKAQFSGDKLVRPEGYREWIYLSSGLGMNYNPMPGSHEMFTNVFVPQWAYREFVASGKWPDKTWFVLEERDQQTKGSINKTGHFQTDLMGLAVEVKDTSRFADKWVYFNFGTDDKTATANPKKACWECHEDNAAVEHSFVQFYPTLKPIAQKFGTYRQAAEAVPAER